jgi:enoyl-[acyl-carrier protein] reductase I
MPLLSKKRILITGLLSNRSIAYGIAQAMHREGAELAFTYYGHRFKDRIDAFAAEFGASIVIPCDAGDDNSILEMATQLTQHWDHLHGLVHSIAFAPADQLEGRYTQTLSREGFRIAHDVSSYSLAALTQATRHLLNQEPSSVLTLTYLGSQRAVAHYNVMGLAKASLEANVRYLASDLGPEKIRVNGISAGPIRTLAASGIKDFRKILDFNEKVTPLRANVTIEDVGNVAAFLCSDLARGITGEIVHVDNGYHAVDPMVF